MALGCNAGGAEASLLADLAGYADCSARALGQSGFAASGFGGGLPAGLLAACLTVYVALLGYRMLLGEAFDARAIVLAAVRVGVVTTFCLNWSSFEQVVYRVVIDGPAEIAAGAMGGPSPDLRAIGTRAQRDYETVQFDPRNGVALLAPSGMPLQSQLQSGPTAQPGRPHTVPDSLTAEAQSLGPRPVTLPGAIFLTSAAGGVIAVRLAAGLLLAIGPLIIAFGLFNSGLGLVAGWLRAMAAMTLASAGLMVTSLLELDFVDARIAASPPDMLSPQGLMVIGIIFSVVSLVMIGATGVAARGIRLPLRLGAESVRAGEYASRQAASTPASPRAAAGARAPEPASRAQSIADAIAAQARREQRAWNAGPEGTASWTPLARAGREAASGEDAGRPPPLGHSLRRTPQARRSVSVIRREGRQ